MPSNITVDDKTPVDDSFECFISEYLDNKLDNQDGFSMSI